MPPSYLLDNDAALARLIKDGAIFIRDVGAAAPTGLNWVPTPGVDHHLGYYSDDGFALTPVPGDENSFTGHNGDSVIAETDPGWWTVGFSGIEARQKPVEVYFDTEVDQDGSVTVTSAAASKRYDLISVGLDQRERLTLIHYPDVQISEREAMTFNRSTLLATGMTFRTFRGSGSAPYHFKAWGFVPGDDGSS